MKKGLLILSALMFVFSGANAFAHFQLVHTDSFVIDESTTEVPMKLVFTHPFDAGHTMDIGKNEKGEVKGIEKLNITHAGKTVDSADKLKEIEFKSLENSGVAYDFVLNKESKFRGAGDWVITAIPHPYYEGAEDIYIQQITKVILNKSDIATDWSDRVADGYPEILPLVKPYDVWAGGIFRGIVVDGRGNPVAGAEIEVEYINYDIDMKSNAFTGEKKIKKDGHGAAVLIADENGNFSFVPNRAGFWGFAALGAGGELTFDGKELSQDAVIWIEAKEIE